ncbi:hypothetical protein A9G28_11365 [Gilliamella sp. Fer1-1]|jgi:uncharacterized membrane protein YhaH (DUF805 family)|uniref:DUF805 domain-containing protein n=1 Tax=unclassified Gilliamella TaxID=2685620 RepID=UPI00080D97E6|nr:DUF805 domain-containing protein [Gilliamella apicola]OCG31250.1 hypothetical protein A9G46_10930 [Gilliamella apicola]OCG32159.1 hypothetical protein A9G45_12425 [Gilliamella apicola]OCG45899.1 hypothetical protein A9G28_11365 [Gilliamella apicola]
MNWFIDGITKNYANFNGRARRKEYWMYVLFSSILTVIAIIIDKMIGSPLMVILTLALFLPNLAVTVRRLHDTSKSGWWVLLQFIPFIGAIIIIVFCVQDSTPGSNQYGENPKGLQFITNNLIIKRGKVKSLLTLSPIF